MHLPWPGHTRCTSKQAWGVAGDEQGAGGFHRPGSQREVCPPLINSVRGKGAVSREYFPFVHPRISAAVKRERQSPGWCRREILGTGTAGSPELPLTGELHGGRMETSRCEPPCGHGPCLSRRSAKTWRVIGAVRESCCGCHRVRSCSCTWRWGQEGPWAGTGVPHVLRV